MVCHKFFKVKKTSLQGGFSLIELVVAMALMLVAAAAVVPNLRASYSRYALYTAAREMAENIRYCQQQAVSAGETTSTYSILFDTVGEKYYIRLDSTILTTFELPPTVDLDNVNFPRNPVKFNQTGRPADGGGTITLKDKVTLSFYYVIINPFTGRVQLSPVYP